MYSRLTLVMAGFSVLACPAIAATMTMAVFECGETQACDFRSKCVSNTTRLVVAQVSVSANNAPYLSIGPLTEGASGSLFFSQEWQLVRGDLPAPTETIGRAYRLKTESGGKMTAHVYRPGREVAGMKNANWVRTDYSCEQVLF